MSTYSDIMKLLRESCEVKDWDKLHMLVRKIGELEFEARKGQLDSKISDQMMDKAAKATLFERVFNHPFYLL